MFPSIANEKQKARISYRATGQPIKPCTRPVTKPPHDPNPDPEPPHVSSFPLFARPHSASPRSLPLPDPTAGQPPPPLSLSTEIPPSLRPPRAALLWSSGAPHRRHGVCRGRTRTSGRPSVAAGVALDEDVDHRKFVFDSVSQLQHDSSAPICTAPDLVYTVSRTCDCKACNTMASPISVRTSSRHPLRVAQSSSVRSPQATQLATRAANPLFPCAKLSKARAVVAGAMEVSKAPSSPGLANCQPSKDVLETWRNADAVCFDVDSTVCLDEGIDELADFCGAGQAVAEWTAKAMTGTVPFEEALSARISLIKPSLSQVEDCLEKRPPRISPGISDLIKKLKANNIEVFLVSGGLRQMIKPVAFELGIPTENIRANQLLFGTSGESAGFDPTEPTSRSGGKAVSVQQIRQDRGYKTVIMIGDGATDLEARQPGGADLFICYAGVQMRETVAAKADWTVFDFQELIAELP